MDTPIYVPPPKFDEENLLSHGQITFAKRSRPAIKFLGTDDTQNQIYSLIIRNKRSDMTSEVYQTSVSIKEDYSSKDYRTNYFPNNGLYTLDYQFYDLDYLNSYFNSYRTTIKTFPIYDTRSDRYVTVTTAHTYPTKSTKVIWRHQVRRISHTCLPKHQVYLPRPCDYLKKFLMELYSWVLSLDI